MLVAQQARCFAQPPQRPLQASRRRARGVTRIAARVAAPKVLVAPRAADFHRVFAASCFVKVGRRFALVAGSFRCNGDAGDARLNCEVFVLDGAESARIRVRALRSSSQACKQSSHQVQETSARTHCSAQWPWNLARARGLSDAPGQHMPLVCTIGRRIHPGPPPLVGRTVILAQELSPVVVARRPSSKQSKPGARHQPSPLQILWQNRVLQRHHRLLLLISWQCLPHVEGVLRAAIIP